MKLATYKDGAKWSLTMTDAADIDKTIIVNTAFGGVCRRLEGTPFEGIYVIGQLPDTLAEFDAACAG